MRTAQITRKTNETDIQLSLNLDGRGESAIESGVGFLDHMLTLLSRHGRMDLELTCRGDTYVDDHHTVEDIGIALGLGFAQALGEKRGVRRYASLCLPMDEALILCAVDLSGRGGYYEDLDIPTEKIGTFDTQLVYEFMEAFQGHPPYPEAGRPQLPPHRGGGLQGPGPRPPGGGLSGPAVQGRNSIHQGDAVRHSGDSGGDAGGFGTRPYEIPDLVSALSVGEGLAPPVSQAASALQARHFKFCNVN